MPEGDWINQKFLNKCKTVGFDIYEKNPKYGFGWWFAYFFKELRGASASDVKLRAALAKVYAHLAPTAALPTKYTEKNAILDGIAAKVATLKQPADLLARPHYYRQILMDIFELGFVLMPRETLPAQIKEPTIGKEKMHKQTFTDKAKAAFAIRVEAEDSQHKKVEMAIGFRGDTRGFETIVEHEGALNRIDMATRGPKQKQKDLAYLNMNAAWNPFSDPSFSAKSNMYLRRTSGDNCLFSVLSIGDRLNLSVGFPLIEDEEIYGYERHKPMTDWIYADYRKMTGGVKLALVRGVFPGGKTRAIMLASECHVYAVKFSSKKHFVHTQNLVGQLTQDFDQCPERGVRGVKLQNFLAGIKLRRIHFGPRRCCGMATFVQDRRYLIDNAWTANGDDTAIARCHFLGDKQAAGLAKAKLVEMLGRQVIAGEKTEGDQMTVMAIDQWGLTWEQFKTYREQDEKKKEFFYCPVA